MRQRLCWCFLEAKYFQMAYPVGYAREMRVQTTEIYRDWINNLKDRVARARIQVRVDRRVHSNPGQHRNYTKRDKALVVLLAGGDKSSQAKDVKTAVALARGL